MTKQVEIPADILHKLSVDYKGEEYDIALRLIGRIQNDSLNVGWVQLSRAIIIIAEKDLSKMKSIIDDRYWGDPRDVLMEASTYPGKGNYYGNEPYEIEKID